MPDFMQQIIDTIKDLPQNFRSAKRGIANQWDKLESLLDQAAGLKPGDARPIISLDDLAKGTGNTFDMLKTLGSTAKPIAQPLVRDNTYLKKQIDKHMESPEMQAHLKRYNTLPSAKK